MTAVISNPPRFVLAAFVAGVWVVGSGILMAAAFGYRDMKAAFDAIHLPIPQGMEPFIVHTLVRLVMGAAVVALFVLMAHVLTPTRALLVAVGFAWLLVVALPYVLITEWGLFPWSVAGKLLSWSAGELLIAGLIGRWLYGTAALGTG